MSAVDQVVEAAKNLSLEEREIVADLILESLDADTLTSVDQAWLKEAEARYQRLCDGESTTVSMASVLQEIRGKTAE